MAPNRFVRFALVSTALALAGAGAACRAAPAVQAVDARQAQKAHYAGKLPHGVTPLHYDVHWTLDPNDDHFGGEVAIAIDAREPRARLFLHAEGLEFQAVWGEDAEGRRQPAQVHKDITPGLISLTFASPLPAGPSTLRFVYRGAFDRGLMGLYRNEVAGRRYVFSQFEAIAARRALPCFDEPRFKTPFQVRVTAPIGDHVLGNAPAIGEQTIDLPGRPAAHKTISFAPTPPLPTYLLAVAVGPFDAREQELEPTALRNYGVPLRALSVAGEGNRLGTSLESTARLLPALERYVDLAYPFAKLDLLAVPDFSFGAMENAGLITFRDWLVLQDARAAPHDQRRAAFSVLSHELTHQWFGNWVTMPWWDDLWLNEAFATWRGQMTAHGLRPGLGFDLDMVHAADVAMHVDRLVSARRVREPCRNRDDVANAADTMSYQKGASLLAMADHWLGSERMTRGVRGYLAQHPFGNATSGEFLAAVAKGAEEPRLPAVMQTFLGQAGVPELSLSLSCEEGRPVLALGQDRYRPLGSDAAGGQWQVPVCVRYGDEGRGHKACRLLDEATDSWPLHGRCPRWLVANADGAGYYRVRLGPEALLASLAAWRGGRMNAGESISWLDNVQAEMDAGALAPEVALGLMAEALQKDEPAVVAHGAARLASCARRPLAASATDGHAGFAQLLRPAAARVAAAVSRARQERGRRLQHGAEGERAADRLGQVTEAFHQLRAVQLRHAGEPALKAELSQAGVAWLARLETRIGKPGTEAPLAYAPPAPPEAATADVEQTLVQAAHAMGMPFVERMVEALSWVTGGVERLQLIHALSRVAKPELAAAVRALALEGKVHTNEVLTLLSAQLSTPVLADAAWAFLQEHVDVLMERTGDEHWSRIIGMAAARCDLASAAQLGESMSPRAARIPGGPRVLAQTEETIRLCAAESASNDAGIKAWFDALPVAATASSAEQTPARP